MKLFVIIFAICISVEMLAQISTEAFVFNHKLLDIAGIPISNKNLSIQVSISKNSENGPIHFMEYHNLKTDVSGQLRLNIGKGIVQSGSLEKMEWNKNNYYIKVAIDSNAGNNFSKYIHAQLFSTPHQNNSTAANQSEENKDKNFNHFIGELYGGGVIFHLWKDDKGVEHGLIADIVDLKPFADWENSFDKSLVGLPAQVTTHHLSGQVIHLEKAEDLCFNSKNGGMDDWYLPSISELNLLWMNRDTVNKKLLTIIGSKLLQSSDFYWSSTMYCNYFPYVFAFGNAVVFDANMIQKSQVRAVRSF